MASGGRKWQNGWPKGRDQGDKTMSLLNRTIRAAESLNAEDSAEAKRAAKLAPLAPKEDVPAAAESDLAHALRTRRMLRTPLSTKR